MNDDDDLVDEANGHSIFGSIIARTGANNIKNQLNTIVAACRDVLKKVKHKVHQVNEDPNQVCDFGKLKRLSLNEHNFYKANCSVKKILTKLKEKIDAAGPFKLFPDELLSEEQKQGNIIVKVAFQCMSKYIKHGFILHFVAIEERKVKAAASMALDTRRIMATVGARDANHYLNSGSSR